MIIVPSGVPTRLQTTAINSTTLLLSWHVPDGESTNGILRRYHVEVTDNTSNIQSIYIADDTHLLITGLQLNHRYTFRVAAYTSSRGPYSLPVSTILQGNGKLSFMIHIEL